MATKGQRQLRRQRRDLLAFAWCISYTTDVSFPGGSPGSVLSTLLVGDQVGPSVGAIEVRDLSLRHGRLGALLVALYWLPYSDAPADLPLTANDLAGASRARAVLKGLKQGQGAQQLANVSFADYFNASLGVDQPSPPTLTGAYRPSSPLSVFTASNVTSRGRWVLRLADLGENWQERKIELQSWTLVLCPPANSSLPALLELSMAQQALGDGSVFRGAASGLGSGVRLNALSGGPLAAAIGTLVTRDASIQYKTYSQLADAAVSEVIGGIDNIQTLLGLPYTPTPLIKTFQPWVELLIGGSELIIQNQVWPGKIVAYALDIEQLRALRPTALLLVLRVLRVLLVLLVLLVPLPGQLAVVLAALAVAAVPPAVAAAVLLASALRAAALDVGLRPQEVMMPWSKGCGLTRTRSAVMMNLCTT
ncbi:hypothetical protein PLESTM_000170000 [Pleodorina starrii]|nr:hypothetical protein PLESTM_000170000 [Pleodorina starrii]